MVGPLGLLVGCLVGWLFGCRYGFELGWPIGKPVSRLDGQGVWSNETYGEAVDLAWNWRWMRT